MYVATRVLGGVLSRVFAAPAGSAFVLVAGGLFGSGPEAGMGMSSGDLPSAPAVAEEEVWDGAVHDAHGDVALRFARDQASSPWRVSLPELGWFDLRATKSAEGRESAFELSIYGERARFELSSDDPGRGRWRGFGFEGDIELERAAPRVRSESFSADGVELGATLFLPVGDGPFPVIVWTHGSGPITRVDPIYRGLGLLAVEGGVASLVYDKRPVGPETTFDDVADDALAFVRALAAHPEIDEGRIGVGGLSQGGWVAPHAAGRSDDVDFVVALSAPGCTPAEQNVFNQANKLRARLSGQAGEAAAELASSVLRAIYEAFRLDEPAGKRALEAALARAADEPWFSSAHELAHWKSTGFPEERANLVALLEFDPVELWRNVRVPVLALWGMEDEVVPVRASTELIGRVLAAEGNDVERRVLLPSTGHDLRLPAEGERSFGPVHPRLAEIATFARSLGRAVQPYPATRSADSVDVFHGEDVPAPFAWLRLETEEQEGWVRDQDALARDAFAGDPYRAEIRRRLSELHGYARAPVPVEANGILFADGQYADSYGTDIHVVDPGGGPPRILVDSHDHPAAPDELMALSPPVPSPDGTVVLYGSSSQSTSQCLRFVDVASGEPLDDTISITYWPWRVAWMADSSGVLYVDGGSVRVHWIGTESTDDTTLYRAKAGTAPTLAVATSMEGTHAFVTVFDDRAPRTEIFVHRFGDEGAQGPVWRSLTAGRSGDHRVVGVRDGRLFLYTTFVPRTGGVSAESGGRVVVLDLEEDEEAWSEVVPEMPEPVWDGNHPLRPAVGLFGDRLALIYAKDGRVLLRAFDLEGALQHEVLHPTLGFNESGLIGSSDPAAHAVVRYDVQSMLDPGSAFELDLVSGERRRLGTSTVPFDPNAFELVHREYASSDGTRVPILFAHRRGLEPDGTARVIVNHRSGSGMVARLPYLPSFHIWLEMGGIFAIPGVRGGGEHGAAWRDAGLREHVPTAIEDVVSAARWFVAEGYAAPRHVVSMGMSAGAPVAASAFLQHPGDYGAGVFKIAQLDMLRHTGSVESWGTSAEPAGFEVLRSWSPVHVVRDRVYPPVLVQTGSDDPIAAPSHSYELVATLQSKQRGPAPILLQVAWNAGHSQGYGIPTQSETYSLQYAFLARELNMEPERLPR